MVICNLQGIKIQYTVKAGSNAVSGDVSSGRFDTVNPTGSAPWTVSISNGSIETDKKGINSSDVIVIWNGGITLLTKDAS